MKKKASLLPTDTLSLEKIIIRTKDPCEVSNPVLHTYANAPWSGANGICGFSGGVTCKAMVPPCKREFLSRPSGCKNSFPGLKRMDSFNKGVDSPDNMASLTIAVPSSNNKSQGNALSSFVLVTEITSPGNNWSVCNWTHFLSLYT